MSEICRKLDEAFATARQSGWDAGEGEAVRQETYDEARGFLASLPEIYRPTDVYPEPDGDLAFEWYRSRDRLVIVSFDGLQRAIYTVRLPGERGSGQVQLVDHVPDVILMHLQRWIETGAIT